MSAAPETKDAPTPPESVARSRGYSMANIFATLPKTSVDDLSLSAHSVTSTPCFRRAFLWSSGVGVLLAAHRAKQGGSAMAATGAGVLSGLFTFGTQWYLCRQEEYDRKIATKAYYSRQQAVQAGLGATVQHDTSDPAYRDKPAPPA
jgi:hypothetical protein